MAGKYRNLCFCHREHRDLRGCNFVLLLSLWTSESSVAYLEIMEIVKRRQETENRRQMTEDGRQLVRRSWGEVGKTDDGGRKIEDRGQRAEDGKIER